MLILVFSFASFYFSYFRGRFIHICVPCTNCLLLLYSISRFIALFLWLLNCTVAARHTRVQRTAMWSFNAINSVKINLINYNNKSGNSNGCRRKRRKNWRWLFLLIWRFDRENRVEHELSRQPFPKLKILIAMPYRGHSSRACIGIARRPFHHHHFHFASSQSSAIYMDCATVPCSSGLSLFFIFLPFCIHSLGDLKSPSVKPHFNILQLHLCCGNLIER